MKEKIFFHVDVNSAYLSWEAVKRSKENSMDDDLRNIASAVAGDPSKRSGIVLAKSQIAKKFGVKTGEPIEMAKRKCPQLYIVPANFDLYIENSNKLIELLNQYSPNVYQYSIDEAFIDMTGTDRLFGEAKICADNMRERIKKELGFTVNIGIGNNMLTAKMAGEFSKPDKTHTLFEDEIESKMWPLAVEELFFVGSKTAKKLRNLGFVSIGDIANSDINFMRKRFKKHGEVIHKHANGEEGYTFLKKEVKNKSIGNSSTTAYDIVDVNQANQLILSLCETVCARLRKKNMKAGVVSIEMVDMNFEGYSKQRKLSVDTNAVNIIYKEACAMFLEIWNKMPIRHIGVSTSSVANKKIEQMNFFDDINDDKEEKLYDAVDEIREKYGEDSIKRAIFLGNDISHMEGGISKKKKDKNVYL
ncbi:MAG: DNA polymerase IV [Peptostreptococcus sp.]|uniref:DNA polymerase Y family protein n=1 Tax=Peptostreptococcus sp. TaxID=1262 RepID=UPI002FCAAD51